MTGEGAHRCRELSPIQAVPHFKDFAPLAIRTDNGTPFASVGLGSLSPLAVWWVKLGIIPERIEPGHPEQNGRLERLHRTLKAETASPPQTTSKRQQRAFDTFRQTYNSERPHEALGQQPPDQHYSPSSRSYPRRVSSPEYEVGVTVRQVRTNGEIKWKGDKIYLSESLRGEPVGLAPQDERYWTVRVWSSSNRAAGRPGPVYPEYTYKSVTYVPGLSVPHLPGRTMVSDSIRATLHC